jgi:hypothetical protein
MEDLTLEELKQLLIFYRQKSNELEFETLKFQLKNARMPESIAVDKKTKP